MRVKNKKIFKKPEAVFLRDLARRVEEGNYSGVLGVICFEQNGARGGMPFCVGEWSVEQILESIKILEEGMQMMIKERENVAQA